MDNCSFNMVLYSSSKLNSVKGERLSVKYKSVTKNDIHISMPQLSPVCCRTDNDAHIPLPRQAQLHFLSRTKIMLVNINKLKTWILGAKQSNLSTLENTLVFKYNLFSAIKIPDINKVWRSGVQWQIK